MGNKNYNRGVEKERQSIDDLQVSGFDTSRTAGSHGLFDVIATMPFHTRLIQIKRAKTEKELVLAVETVENELREKGYKSYPGVTYEVWTWLDKQGWHQRKVL